MTLQSEDMGKLVAVLWGCADGNGIDERYVFHEKAVADHVAGLYGLTVVPLYARATPEGQTEGAVRDLLELFAIQVGDLAHRMPGASLARLDRLDQLTKEFAPKFLTALASKGV